MGRTHYLHYSGLAAPIALQDASALGEYISTVIPAWPRATQYSLPQAPPFVTIRPAANGKWAIDAHVGNPRTREWDAVDVVCDLISEMAWERLRSHPELLCLHAAAVDFGGRLVVFPNARRAGKSTLAIALARLGHKIFTDDFLPIEVDRSGATLLGIANGIAPRLRLPLPETFSRSFQTWVEGDPGPENKRYKYLTAIPLAQGMVTLPLGAVVILERQEEMIDPRLRPIDRPEALASMIRQNFSRDMHSGRILKSIEALTEHVPFFCMTYWSAEDAAVWLHEHPDLSSLPAARIDREIPDGGQSPVGHSKTSRVAFNATLAYVQAPGLSQTEVSGECFLADRAGLTIHRLNQGSVAIWQILSEPTALKDVAAIISAAFPDVDKEQVHVDSENTMRQLAHAGLIEAEQPVMDDQGAQIT